MGLVVLWYMKERSYVGICRNEKDIRKVLQHLVKTLKTGASHLDHDNV